MLVEASKNRTSRAQPVPADLPPLVRLRDRGAAKHGDWVSVELLPRSEDSDVSEARVLKILANARVRSAVCFHCAQCAATGRACGDRADTDAPTSNA
jgi:hypothetical protein